MGKFDLIDQTPETVFHHISKTSRRELKFLESTGCSGAFLTNFEVFGDAIKHSLDRVFDISS